QNVESVFLAPKFGECVQVLKRNYGLVLWYRAALASSSIIRDLQGDPSFVRFTQKLSVDLEDAGRVPGELRTVQAEKPSVNRSDRFVICRDHRCFFGPDN